VTILLTGSSGWLGRHIGEQLSRGGQPFTGLDVAPGQYTNVVGSIADRALVEALMAGGISAVIHAAALHKPQIELRSAQDFVDVNVTGTLNLLDAAVRRGVGSFVMTSTTSVMVTQQIHDGGLGRAVFLDEASGPLEPRNIYGVTKLAAEGLARTFHLRHGLPVVILRTSRFFPEDDDRERHIAGPNLKANELLFRRLSVRDAARAHLIALERAPELGFGLFVLSAPTPFEVSDAELLAGAAPGVIARYFPHASAIYAKLGWTIPDRIERVYVSTRSREVLGVSYADDFGSLLARLDQGELSPVGHDPAYRSPVDEVPGPLLRGLHRSGT
jgi:nucleoside-diphosphate-sugar epimerase